MKVIGWTGAYTSNYKSMPLTKEKEGALKECIRKRHYNFNHFDHEYMDFCAPLFEDGTICVLNRNQFNDVMNSVYALIPIRDRLMPSDVIKREAINGVLYEKSEFEPKDGEKDG